VESVLLVRLPVFECVSPGQTSEAAGASETQKQSSVCLSHTSVCTGTYVRCVPEFSTKMSFIGRFGQGCLYFFCCRLTCQEVQ